MSINCRRGDLLLTAYTKNSPRETRPRTHERAARHSGRPAHQHHESETETDPQLVGPEREDEWAGAVAAVAAEANLSVGWISRMDGVARAEHTRASNDQSGGLVGRDMLGTRGVLDVGLGCWSRQCLSVSLIFGALGCQLVIHAIAGSWKSLSFHKYWAEWCGYLLQFPRHTELGTWNLDARTETQVNLARTRGGPGGIWIIIDTSRQRSRKRMHDDVEGFMYSTF